MSSLANDVQKIFISPIDEASKRYVQKEGFISHAGEKAQQIKKLAENALENKGRVLVCKDNERKSICWAIIERVRDSREDEKPLYHYDTVFLGSAEGCDEAFETFKNSAKSVIRSYISSSTKLQYANFNGETIYPQSAFGMKGFDSFGKKKIQKPEFTDLVPDNADTVRKLAEHALETKGKVYVLKNDEKKCVCWCIIDLVVDGTEGKKEKRHFNATYFKAAKGYENKFEEFMLGVKGMINEKMYLWGQAEYLDMGDEIIEPYKTSDNPNLSIAVAMGLIFGIIFKSYFMGLCFFLMYLSIGTSYKVISKKKKAEELKKSNSDN